MEPDVRYCTTTDGVTIAYAVAGHGKPWLVHTSNDLAAALQFESMPARRQWLEALAEHFTVVRYDSRGTGLSQRDCEDLSWSALVRDLAAVIDAIDAPPVVLFGHLGGTWAAALYSSQEPARVRQLVLWPPPFLDFNDGRNRSLGRLAVTDWETFTETYAHIALGWGRGEESHQFALIWRETMPRETWLRFMGQWNDNIEDSMTELSDALSKISIPTLVIQRSSYEEFPRVAGLIRGSRTKMVDGEGVGPMAGDPRDMPAVVDAIAEFAGVTRAGDGAPAAAPTAAPSIEHGTAVILFTDIADSTGLTERMGDAAFRARSRTIDEGVRAAIHDYDGTPVHGKVLGDGVMGVFASATQAIQAARRCVELSADLPLHVGLHAGDVIREDDNVYGGAVNIASRICALCEPGEILVSATVRELARTSAGVAFEDRGEHTLKGVADAVRVFVVRRESG